MLSVCLLDGFVKSVFWFPYTCYTVLNMTKLTRDDVLKLARLSRLKLTEAEILRFTKEITAILEYVAQLQRIDLKDYQPTTQVTGLVNVMRADAIIDYGTTPQELLQNAPAVEKHHFKVKRMLG